MLTAVIISAGSVAIIAGVVFAVVTWRPNRTEPVNEWDENSYH